MGHSGHQFLFGGIALAACLTALENTFALPVAFASAQFLAFAKPDEELLLDPQLTADGNSTKQAFVEAGIGGRRIVAVQAALGRRDNDAVHQAAAMPQVAAAWDCPPASVARLLSSNMNRLFEVRLAGGRLPGCDPWEGPVADPVLFWARARDGSPASRPILAILGDFLSIGIPSALGRNATGNSLDNHIRFVAPPDGHWVLCAIMIEAIRDGMVHGHLRQFGEDGRLLAIAGQSMILRAQRPSERA